MKTITVISISRMVLLAAFIIITGTGFTQGKPEAQQQKYRLYITKTGNGNKEVIDKTFSSKEEMDAYIRENKIDMPDNSELGDLPDAPAPPALPSEPNDKLTGKRPVKKITKKITIVEKEESNNGGKTKMEIESDDLTPEERAQIEQEVLNVKGGEVEMIVVSRIGKEKIGQAETNTQEPVPTAIAETKANKEDNISDMKLYPNPGNGQFHVEFNVGKPADVKLRITDLQGKEVYAEALNNYSGRYEKNISRSELSSGTYVMYVEAGGEKKVTKVVMQ